MLIDAFLTPHGVSESDVRDKTVVIIDVLRTTSTMITALSNGAKMVVPAATQGDAGRIAKNLDASVFLLGGEKDGLKIDGYHLGNSPLEYTPEKVKGRTLIVHTSRTTETAVNLKSAGSLILGSFINYRRVVDFVKATNKDTVFVCSGFQNKVSIVDTACVGLILNSIWRGNRPKTNLTDAVAIAHTIYLDLRDTLEERLAECTNAKQLRESGFGSDIEVCTGLNTVPVLPLFDPNTLSFTPHPESSAS